MSFLHTNIKVLREEARLTIADFASAMEVDLETAKRWEKGKVVPSNQEIQKMCPLLRISYEDMLERDILSERREAGSMMKKSHNRQTYNWYYGDTKKIAFYLVYLVLIPSLVVLGYFGQKIVFDIEPDMIRTIFLPYFSIEVINKNITLLMWLHSYYLISFVAGVMITVKLAIRIRYRFQWWHIFWYTVIIFIIEIGGLLLMIPYWGYSFYKAIIKRGKN